MRHFVGWVCINLVMIHILFGVFPSLEAWLLLGVLAVGRVLLGQGVRGD